MKNLKGNYLLILTDGYDISTSFFKTKEEASALMKKEYNNFYPEENDESSAEMSFCREMDAILYCNGDNVYVWQVVCLVQ